MKPKIIRVTTLPISMNILLRNQLRFMSFYFNVIGITSKDTKHFPEIIQREGIRLVSIKLTRSISLITDLIALLKMIHIFVREKPQIVHSHTPKAGLLAMLAARLVSVPVRLHTLSGLPLSEATGIRKRIFRVAERITGSCAHRVYPNSAGLKRLVIEERLYSPDKLKIIGNGSSNGIDLEYFNSSNFDSTADFRKNFRSTIGISEDDIVFCFIGRIVKDKGIKELIHSFHNLLIANERNTKTLSRIVLLLVGPLGTGDNRIGKHLEHTIQTHSEIEYVGRKDDIRPYLLASDVFVFPSYREGFPNVVMQAGAMDLPCIVTDINGCNEIVVNMENGLIVQPKDIDSLSGAMQLLLDNPALRANMASKARKMVADRYNQKDFWAALLEEYNDLLEAKEII